MRRQPIYFFATFLFAFAVTAAAQEYTSPHEVLQNEALRQDFTVQGEYLAEPEGFKMGLHLIADGGGKFRVVAYPGGLPGDGWKAGEPRLLGTAELNGNEIAFNMTEGRGNFAGLSVAMPEKIEAKGKIIIETPQRGQRQGGAEQGGGAPRQGQGAGQFRGGQLVKIELPATVVMPEVVFEKQNRRSPTFRQEAPEGAIVLFDGTNVDKFQPGAKMNEAQQTQRPGGAAIGNTLNTLWAEAATPAFEKKPYKMHIEFMLSYMPQARGQGRSNSGVYIDERYECQVLDSFGLEGENNECGGFYTIAKPLVNMCFPPLTWQTYDFEFYPAKYDGNNKVAPARITVVHNGVTIHDNIELQGTPGRRNEGPEPLGLYLQGHGNKVQYRNIWIQYTDEPVASADVVEAPAQQRTTRPAQRRLLQRQQTR